MFDNLKRVTRSLGATAAYVADRLEHANVEANVDDAMSLAKKVSALQEQGGLAIQLFNSFQQGRRITLTLEENNDESKD